jgi:hypothetical protein
MIGFLTASGWRRPARPPSREPVCYLIQLHLITKAHRPGERRDVYRLLSDHSYEMVGNRDHELQQWAKAKS